MGVCREFGPQIDPDCEHPMRPGADSCTCSRCGAHCTGRFPACPQVWHGSAVAVAVRAPEHEAGPQPDPLDDTLPDLWDEPAPPTYAPSRRTSGAAWSRRRPSPRLLPPAALVFLGALLLFAAGTSNERESPDRLSVTDQTQVTTPATTAAPAAPPPPAPTTLPDAPPTTAAAPPPTAAPPPPQSAPAAQAPARASARAPAPARQPARATPAPTVGQFPRMCGFVPGGPVDVLLNGRPAGEQTADRNGCVSRPPRR